MRHLFLSILCICFSAVSMAQSIVGDWEMIANQDNAMTVSVHLLFNANGKCECRAVMTADNSALSQTCFASIPGTYTLVGDMIEAKFNQSKYYYKPIQTQFKVAISADKKAEYNRMFTQPMETQLKPVLKEAVMQMTKSDALRGTVVITNRNLSIDGNIFTNVSHADNLAKTYGAQTQSGTRKPVRRK